MRSSFLRLTLAATVYSISFGNAEAHDCSYSARRLADAQRLTDQAMAISQRLGAVRQSALRILLAQGVTETLPAAPAGATGSGSALPAVNASPKDRYVQLLLEYHQALSAYIQHRKDVAAHAQEFHQQAQDQKALDSSIDVPQPKMLALRAQDACYQLQNQERILYVEEVQMSNLINQLVTERGQVPPDAFMKEWVTGQSDAMALMQQAHNFEDGVFEKHTQSSNQMHDQVHLAFDSGDYVGSQKVFDEVNRRNALIQDELQRASTHMSLAREFMLKLNLLNPQAAAGSSGGGASSNGSFADADAELEREYQHVQELYAQLQSSRPTR